MQNAMPLTKTKLIDLVKYFLLKLLCFPPWEKLFDKHAWARYSFRPEIIQRWLKKLRRSTSHPPKPNKKLRSKDGWLFFFSKIQGKWEQCHCAPAAPLNHPLTWKLDEWLFCDFYFSDLYDAFIESNKKEDAAERMWSIRSVVSVFVCM